MVLIMGQSIIFTVRKGETLTQIPLHFTLPSKPPLLGGALRIETMKRDQRTAFVASLTHRGFTIESETPTGQPSSNMRHKRRFTLP